MDFEEVTNPHLDYYSEDDQGNDERQPVPNNQTRRQIRFTPELDDQLHPLVPPHLIDRSTPVPPVAPVAQFLPIDLLLDSSEEDDDDDPFAGFNAGYFPGIPGFPAIPGGVVDPNNPDQALAGQVPDAQQMHQMHMAYMARQTAIRKKKQAKRKDRN